jgi:Zn-dependent M28 family amino/carboxypeptidase
VAARLPGSDAVQSREHVIYNAHWDHIGRNPQLEGDQIFNGAVDNASGTAGLLELAEAFARLPKAPPRSLLFLAVTAEEFGLLGAKHYAENPLYPLRDAVAVINMDGLNLWGRKRDVEVIGLGQSNLEDWLRRSAQSRGQRLVPESAPEKGYFYRSDHFEFAKKGVPALYVSSSGNDYVGRDPDFGRLRREAYVDRDYHKVSDEVKPDWDLSGAVEDLQMLLEVGYAVSASDVWPAWRDGSEFKAARPERSR